MPENSIQAFVEMGYSLDASASASAHAYGKPT